MVAAMHYWQYIIFTLTSHLTQIIRMSFADKFHQLHKLIDIKRAIVVDVYPFPNTFDEFFVNSIVLVVDQSVHLLL
jgi:hypothetical protein